MANYYLGVNNQRKGPFPEEELLRNGMTPDSLVWCKGMAEWKKASEVPELAKYFAAQQLPQLPQLPGPQYAQGQYPQNPQGQYPQYPQYAQGQYQQQEEEEFIPFCPETHLTGAILCTIFCCVPFGIVAIVKASQVEGLYNQGKYDEAEEMSESAQKWINTSIIVGIISAVLYIFAQIILMSNTHSYY